MKIKKTTVSVEFFNFIKKDNNRLENELTILRHVVCDFLAELDNNCVELPSSMHDVWNELEKLTDL